MQFLFPKSISEDIQWRLADWGTHSTHREVRGKENNLSEISLVALSATRPNSLGAQTTRFQPVGTTHLNRRHQWKKKDTIFPKSLWISREKHVVRRRAETNPRWGQEIKNLRRKRECQLTGIDLSAHSALHLSSEDWKGMKAFYGICGHIKNIHLAQQKNLVCNW